MDIFGTTKLASYFVLLQVAAMHQNVPSPKVFSALLSGDIRKLSSCSQDELRPFLPCLARMVLCPMARPSPVAMVKDMPTSSSCDKSRWEGRRKVVHALIAGMSEVNAISKYLALDFHVSIPCSSNTVPLRVEPLLRTPL